MSDQSDDAASGLSRRRFLRYLLGAGLFAYAAPAAAKVLFQSDVNRDGAVTAADAIRALQESSGLIEKKRAYADEFIEKSYANKLLILFEDSANMSPPNPFAPISEMIGFGKMSIQGISVHLEFDGLKILLDTTTDVSILKNNMRVAGIDPASIDVLVLSHVHFDHMNAYKYLLSENPELAIFGPMTKDWMIQNQPNMLPLVDDDVLAGFETVEDYEHIAPRTWLITTESLESDCLPFCPVKETTLVIESDEGLILVTGDCHPSPMRIIDKAKQVTGTDRVYLLVGGTSLVWLSDYRIAWFAEQIASRGVQKLAPCHTTGDVALRIFGDMWDNDLIRTVTDTVIDIPYLSGSLRRSLKG
ncbi:MAG: MBL fold metallo-hydrolase [Candidatus Coatesbacteria bacterium]|nr:MBL fold metallo-hydrolase [Candidatus Coatesbacteria bacterium]